MAPEPGMRYVLASGHSLLSSGGLYRVEADNAPRLSPSDDRRVRHDHISGLLPAVPIGHAATYGQPLITVTTAYYGTSTMSFGLR